MHRTPRNPLFLALTVLLLAALTSASAGAQVIGVLLEPKAQKKAKDHLVVINGEALVVCEPLEGITITGNSIQTNTGGSVQLLVPDPDEPGEPAYEVEKGVKEPSSKKNLLKLKGSDVVGVRLLMPQESLLGLAQEYRIRTAQLEVLRAERDAIDDDESNEWALRQERYVSAVQRLIQWCDSTAFPGAARDLEKDLKRTEKKGRAAEYVARRERARGSLEDVPVDPKFLAAAKACGLDGRPWVTLETQHLAMTFPSDEVDVAEAQDALRFGEEVIDHFRKHLVDPFLQEGYEDGIPDDRIICHFHFVPDSDAAYEGITRDYLGTDWSRDREARLAMGGMSMDVTATNPARNVRKINQLDLEAIVAHQLGHSLARLHYGENASMQQDWLEEAVGYWISFEFLGRNGVTCMQFLYGEGNTGAARKDVGDRGEKTVGEGLRHKMNQVALELGRPIDKLALRTLHEMDDADVAKAWSFFDYVIRAEGLDGQKWLRSAGARSRDRSTFIAEWRKDAAGILGVDPGQAFRELEERWREWAMDLQDTSGDGKRRR